MDYIKQKKLLLEEILSNTQVQTLKIEEDDMEAIDRLIGERELLMKQVDTLDQAAPKEILQEDTESIRGLLAKIIKLDNSNKSLMQNEYDQVKSELLKIRTARRREAVYGDEHGLYKEEGIFFDKGK